MATPATTTHLMQIASDGNFQNRVKYFMSKYALSVMTEAVEVGSHAARVVYAKLVLAGSATVYEQAIGVLTNGTIAAQADASIIPDWGIVDSNVEYQISQQFNAYAGVAL
jgi:hypothetical protein